jgi:hypothetical protein
LTPDPAVLAVIAALSLPTGTAWIDASEASCLTKAIFMEARNRHVDTQTAVAYSVLDRAALDGRSVCLLVHDRRAFPWKRQQPDTRAFAERVAWETAAQIAVLAYVAEVPRPCPGNPTYFDRWPGRWDKWKNPQHTTISCLLDGVAFWRKNP